MNFPESHNTMRNTVLDHDNNAQYYQTSKKANMAKRPPKLHPENKLASANNAYQKSENQSRLNYNSAPFTPKLQPHNMKDPKHMLSDTGADSIHIKNRIPAEHDANYYQQGSNIGYDGYGSNMANQCMYNALDFMPYIMPFTSNGTPSNYWQMLANNSYYGLSNLGLSTNMESNQNMFMMGKNSENSFSTNNTFNSSNIQSNPQQFIQNNRQKQQNHSVNHSSEAPATGISWTDNILEKNISQLNNLSLINQDYNSPLNNERELCQSFTQASYSEILNNVSNPLTKNRLTETMLNINPKVPISKMISRARFFVIKSYSEDDLHRAIKYGVWCSTKTGNKKLNDAYIEQLTVSSPNQTIGRVFLFFSVNGSGFFAGIAEMISAVNFDEQCGFWSQNKWVGKLSIKWHYVKDVRNSSLRHIRSDSNENKPVTNSRDAVEVTPFENGIEFIKVFHQAKHETSVFDDFEHYEQREMNPNAQ